MAKHKAQLKVGIIRHKDIRQLCENYCIVAAIHRSLKLVEKKYGFLRTVFLEAELPNPPELRRIRENIFQKEVMPGLKSLHLVRPKDFAQWVMVYEREKTKWMKEIDAMYAHVTEVDEGQSAKLLVFRRMTAAVGTVAAGAFLTLALGTALVAVGAGASWAVAGTATAEQVTLALANVGKSGVVVFLYSTAQTGVSVHRKMEEMEDAHLIVVVGEVAPMKAVGLAAEHHAHHVAEHVAHAVAERNAYQAACSQALREGSAKLSQNPQLGKMVFKNGKLANLVAKNLTRGAAAGVGLVVCATAELYETYEQFIEDWNADTNHAGHGHGGHEAHAHAHG